MNQDKEIEVNFPLLEWSLVGNYRIVRQRGVYFDERYTTFIPFDIEDWIRNQIKLGYEIGVFEHAKRITIFKTSHFIERP